MSDADIPYVDEEVVKLPTDMREALAERGKHDLYFFAKGIYGNKDMTEACHGPLCKFATSNPARFKMMLQPRDHLKTSVITNAGTLQRAVANVESRNLIRNETGTNATRFLRGIRQNVERNKVFRALYGEVIPKDVRKVRWNDSEIDFARQGTYPEPTISAIGLTGASTSQHFTHITDDDPISEEAIRSERVMASTIETLRNTRDLLVDPEHDTHWLVGTRWAFSDTYSWYEQAFHPAKFIRGAIEGGLPIWPERFTLDGLAEIRHIKGEYLWSCNYMNNPRNAALQDLNVDDLSFWRWKGEDRIELLDANAQVIDSWRIDELDITITVDPASAESVTSDRNAITVVGVTPHNQMVCLECFAERCTPLIVIDKLIEFVKRYGPRCVGIEEVGYQRALKWFLKQRAEAEGVYVRVEPIKALGRTKPHIRQLQPIMAVHKLFIDPTMMLLRQEMSEYPLGEHDDTADSLAMHLQLMKGQLSPEFQKKLDEEAKRLVKRHLTLVKPTDEEMRRRLDLDPDEDIDMEEAGVAFGAPKVQEYYA